MRFSARSVATLGAIGLALGNVGRIPAGALGGRNAPIVVADLAVAALWAVLFLAFASGRARFVIDNVTSAVVGFVLVATISTALAFPRYGLGFTEGAGVLAFLIRWIAYFGWYPFVMLCLTRDESRDAWRDMERALLAIAIFGLFQSAFLPGFAQMLHNGGDLPEWDRQGRRLVSTMLDPNFAGILIVIALIFQLARVAEGGRARILPLVTLAAALVLTVSRSSILALGVGIVVIVAARGLKLRMVKLLATGGVLVLPFVGILLSFADKFHKLGYDASAAQRLIPWTRAVRLTMEQPVFGIGFNAVEVAQKVHGWPLIGGADVSLDGGLLFVAAMTGLLGLFFYVLLLWRVWRSARVAWKDPGLSAGDRAHATATAAATVAVVIHSLFVNSLLLPYVMQVLWMMWGRLAHISAIRRKRLALGTIAAAGTIALAASCEPCAGTSACSTSPMVNVTGQIVDHDNGKAIANAKIGATFLFLDGTSLTRATVTDGDGLWRFSVPSPDMRLASIDFTVESPGHKLYHVPQRAAYPVTSTGEERNYGPWTDIPFTRYRATIIHGGSALPNATVSFLQSGGPPLNTLVTIQGNASGVFELWVTADEPGDATGKLTVTQKSLGKPTVLQGFSVPIEFEYQIPPLRTSIPVGSLLAYGGEVVFRGTGAKAAGVPVEFTRTGGVDATPAHQLVVTNAQGFFRIDLTPATDGVVIGDLTLNPPQRAPVVYHDVHLATYDSIAIRNSGLWAYGEAFHWALELWRNDSLKPAPNLKTTFVRRSGLAITPDSQNLTTGTDGRIQINASVPDSGTVIGDITVFPANGAPRTIKNVSLRTNPDDALHFAGVFGFGPAIRYVGEVFTTDGKPVVGATVTWTQTSGITATPTTLTGTTGSDGRFPLLFYPSTDGEIVGKISIKPPAPYAAGTVFNFDNLHLATFQDGNLHLAITYRVPPP